MPITRKEKFNGLPEVLYKKGLKTLAQQEPNIAALISWDDVGRKGEINQLGVEAKFVVTDSSWLETEISIGFPASMQYSEADVGKYLDQLYGKMKEMFPNPKPC